MRRCGRARQRMGLPGCGSCWAGRKRGSASLTLSLTLEPSGTVHFPLDPESSRQRCSHGSPTHAGVGMPSAEPPKLYQFKRLSGGMDSAESGVFSLRPIGRLAVPGLEHFYYNCGRISVLRPFGACDISITFTQGVALGWLVSGLWPSATVHFKMV